MTATISATEAAKRFSHVLDELESGHETSFSIERHGREVARLEAGRPRRVRWRDVRMALAEGLAPDPEYGSDIAAARAQLETPDDPWAR